MPGREDKDKSNAHREGVGSIESELRPCLSRMGRKKITRTKLSWCYLERSGKGLDILKATGNLPFKGKSQAAKPSIKT
jgi:hypothetical protein